MAEIRQIKIGTTTYDINDSRIITLQDNSTATAGTWLAKTSQISAYADGQIFIYKVAKAGASTTTLNVTGSAGTALGAKTVYRSGSTKVTTQYAVGTYLLLYYSSSLNSGSFLVLNDYDANTNASHSGIGICSTAAATAAKTVTFPNFALATNQTILIRVSTTNTATSGVTLNVNSTGAKSVYIGGSAWSTSNQLNAGDYIATYDGTYWKLTRIYLTDTTYGVATSSALGLVKSSTTGTTSGRDYNVQVNSDGTMKVNVPWTNVNSGYSSSSHKHDYSGTTEANSGTKVVAITGVGANGTATAITGVKVSSSSSAAPGGHTHTYSTPTAISLGSDTTATGGIKYLEDVTYTAAGSSGTGTVGISGGSGSLISYTTQTGTSVAVADGTRIPYVSSISGGSASGTGSGTAAPNEHTHSYTTYSLSGSNSSHTTRYMKVSTTAADTGTVTLSGGSGDLTTNTTSSGGIKYVESIGSFTAGTTPVDTATFSGTKSTDVVTSGTTKYLHWSAGSVPSLTVTSTSTSKINSWSAGTTPISSIEIAANEATTTVITGSYSENTLWLNTTNVASSSHIHGVFITRGSAPSLSYSSVSVGSASGWSAGSAPSLTVNTTSTNALTSIITAVSKSGYTPAGTITLNRGTAPSMGTVTTKYLHHSHSAPSLGGTTTFTTNGIKAVSLSASTSSSDGPAYVATATNSSLSLSTGSGTTGKNSGSGVSTISGVSYTAPTATTYYLAHSHSGASLTGTKTFVTGVSGGSLSKTTKYFHPSFEMGTNNSTTGVNSGTNFNAATGVGSDGTATVLTGVKATGTGDCAPHTHTHSYSGTTGTPK